MRWHLTPPGSTCRVFTFREGLFAGFGHDLELDVTRFTIDVDDVARTVTAGFDANSLRVVRALRDGTTLPDALSPADQASIEDVTAREILRAGSHPEITFRSTAAIAADGGWDVSGVLTIAGAEHPLAVAVRKQGDRWTATVPLHTPDWGIRPFKAMLGALKVKALVRVELSLPAVS
jgi:polyisoprenoid-binding protein YceI